jgi:phosphate transport system substrate-binding protein
MKTKLNIAIYTGIILSLAAMGCGGKKDAEPAATEKAVDGSTGAAVELEGTLNVIGSNTVTPISTAWAEGFMAKHPKARISISGPGSGVGVAAVIDKTTDIGQSSRAIKPQEIEQAKANKVNVVESIIAWDGLAVIVNPNNPVNELTMAQLSDIYLGKTTNWKEVGGQDGKIVVISRDTNSGTHAFFKEFVLNEQEFAQDALFLPSTSTGVTEVSRNPNTIFYAGLGYVTPDVKVVAMKPDADSPGVKPSVLTVNNKSYPLARALYFYTNGEPAGLAKAFIEYGLTPEGANLVEKLGFVPLP